MDKKAAELMGESVVAGVSLDNEKALKNAMKGSLAKSLGGAIGGALAGGKQEPISAPGGHGGPYYIAVGSTKVGFFSIKMGFFKPSLQDLLVEHSRSDIQAIEIGSGYMPTVHFVLKDGSDYVFKCAKLNVKKLKKIQELFAQ